MSILMSKTPAYYTEETATSIANMWSKGLWDNGQKAGWGREYNTALKGEPVYPEHPLECWYITNEFDPRVQK